MTGWADWVGDYNKRYDEAFSPHHVQTLCAFLELARSVSARGGKLMFAGNGASASTAAHGAVDFSKQGGVRSVSFNEANLITCLSNDYGYENWVARAIELYADDADAAVLISVSGQSPNIVKAAEYARSRGLPIVTFTGKRPDNPVKALGAVNFWVGSDAYNVVENIHSIWMSTVVDMLVGRAEYPVT